MQADQLRRVLGADARPIVKVDRTVAVEVHVRSVGVIVKLEIAEQARSGKHILEVHGLAPARVTDDDVGNKSVLAQLLRCASRRLAVQHRRFQILDVAVGLFAGLAR